MKWLVQVVHREKMIYYRNNLQEEEHHNP